MALHLAAGRLISGAAIMLFLPTGIFAASAMKDNGKEAVRQINVSRFSVTSSRPFDEVVATLEAAVGTRIFPRSRRISPRRKRKAS
jgi:hypothetical protein